MTLTPIFLALQGPAGDTKHVQLPRSEPCATTFLPNSCDHGIDLFHRSNGTHSAIRIRAYPTFPCFLLTRLPRNLSQLPFFLVYGMTNMGTSALSHQVAILSSCLCRQRPKQHLAFSWTVRNSSHRAAGGPSNSSWTIPSPTQ